MEKENFKVIEIIDEYTLLINYGFNDGASEGDRLRIYSIGEKVFDPNTKEELGTLDNIKDIVQVEVPYENFSLCKKVRTIRREILNPLSKLVQTTTVSESLYVDKTEISGRKPLKKEPIKTGDLALLLPDRD